MAIVVMESIGFCATHAISEMLRMNGKNHVSHGTQNFIKNTPIGVDNLTFEEFHDQMLKQHGKYENCISVHSNYLPDLVARLVDGTDTRFLGLMRKSQLKQIISCFYWAVDGFLNGREHLTLILGQIQNQHGNSFKKIGLPVNMCSCLMFFAFNHVANFNLLLAKFAQNIIFMEDIIANPADLVETIGISIDSKVDLAVGVGPSHANKVKEYSFLSNADQVLDTIATHARVNFGDRSYGMQEIQQLAMNKSVLNIQNVRLS